MKPKVPIRYEDQLVRGGKPEKYGPHQLVVSCIADDLRIDRALVADRYEAIPMNGNGNLRKACRRIERIGPQGQPVVALFDDDEVRSLLGLPPGTRKRDVARKIQSESDAPERLIVWLLVENLESVVHAAASCLHHSPPPKAINRRDKVLQTVAWGEERLRAELRRRVPSFGCFVRTLAELW